MKANIVRTFVLTSALAALVAGSGCVADRPSRNGVFNENQYVRKDFLIRPGSGGVDPGWIMKSTVLSTSTPNVYAAQGLFAGSENGGSFVRFAVTQDKLTMLNVRELSADADGVISSQGTRQPETTDEWPVTNVDLKYRVNLDGEKTNFYEENQELDWQLRQWVKINFAKNDMADLWPFGDTLNEFLQKCSDAINISATLHPGSFMVDEANGYWQFALDITIPVQFTPPPTVAANTMTGAITSTVDPFCTDAYGTTGVTFQQMGRKDVSLTLMYSFMRAVPDDQVTFQPLVIEEKDPIRRKYGTIDVFTPTRDESTGLLGTRSLSLRYDPTKPLVYYFARGFPDGTNGQPDYTKFFTAPGGIVDQTNALFKASGSQVQLAVRKFDDPMGLAPGQAPREYGDVRYNFIRFMSDLDTDAPFLAVTQFVPDVRTGEILSSSINVANYAWKDYLLARLDYYEQSIGASPQDWSNTSGPCNDGDLQPIVPATIASNHNGKSTLFTKMQQYLQKQVAQFGYLGPQDFVVNQDADFFKAFFTILPYEVFADPATNPFVVPEGQAGYYGPVAQMQALANEANFHDYMGKLDTGWVPYDVGLTGTAGATAGLAFLHQLQQVQIDHNDFEYLNNFRFGTRKLDPISPLTDIELFNRDARHCVGGQWETRDQYMTNMVTSYWAKTIWHEFGHAIGLNHNFMASVDRPNFPTYQMGNGGGNCTPWTADKTPGCHMGMYSSSVMEYDTAADRVFWANGQGAYGWGPYDQAAISFIYANGLKQSACKPMGICNVQSSANASGVVGSSYSGQGGPALDGSGVMVTSANARWNDPSGFQSDGTEHQYLYCDERHLKYSPFCRQFDFGSTPSEIMANEIDNYEWQYLWRNFRQYHKFFDFTPYANGPTAFFTDARRFLSSWAYDWSPGELAFNLHKLGVVPPQGVPANTYYFALALKFNNDISVANQLYAAAAEAIVQQASGERPVITVRDPYFGDTTQQGIIVDKLAAIQSFTALWNVTNYDQDQAGGAKLASFSFGDPPYQTVAENAAISMIGGGYNIFTYAVPAAVLQFATATHDPYFIGGANRPELAYWVGGYTFTREQDFLDFFRRVAIDHAFRDENGNVCTTLQTCAYDPRLPASNPSGDPVYAYHSDVYNQFRGPDNRRWIWTYVPDRNVWVASDRDRNVATYVTQFNYNNDVVFNQDESQFSLQLRLPLKYTLDYFQQFN